MQFKKIGILTTKIVGNSEGQKYLQFLVDFACNMPFFLNIIVGFIYQIEFQKIKTATLYNYRIKIVIL